MTDYARQTIRLAHALDVLTDLNLPVEDRMADLARRVDEVLRSRLADPPDGQERAEGNAPTTKRVPWNASTKTGLGLTFPPPTTHPFAGSNSDRQSVGKPGHCEYCAQHGHVAAHPDLGCGDMGCNRDHDAEEIGQ